MTAGDITYTNSDSTLLNLNDGTTYDLVDIPGIFGWEVETVLVTTPRNMPPAIYVSSNPKSKDLKLFILAKGATASACQTNVHALQNHFWVDVHNKSQGTLAYTALNTSALSAKLALKTFIEGTYQFGQLAAYCQCLCEVTFGQADPTWYGAVINAASAFNGSTPVNVSIANTGNCDSSLTITYTGTATATVNPQVTDDYGHVLKIEDTIPDTKVLIMDLDPESLSITYDGSTNWYGKRSTASQLVVAKPGTHNLVFVADSGTAVIAVTCYPRHSAHG